MAGDSTSFLLSRISREPLGGPFRLNSLRHIRVNEPEDKFELLALSKGWKPTKKGWPDFLCIDKDGKPFAVEVKPQTRNGMKLLKREQVTCIEYLEAAGIPCFVSDGVNLDRYDPKFHNDESRRRKPLDNS